MKLNLGVVDLPYTNRDGTTTAQVAGYLENKYHVMEVFYEVHAEDIAEALTNSLTSALINQQLADITNDSASNAPSPPLQVDPLGDAMAETETMFRQFLTLREIETLGIPGVPTQAALKGVNHRFKKKRDNGPRPSFIDTGLYESAFKAWMDP